MRLKHSNPSGRATSSKALEQMDSAGSHIVAARDETQGMLWQAAEYVLYYGSDVKAVRGMLDAAADAATNALPKIDSAAQGTLVDFNIEELLSGMNFPPTARFPFPKSLPSSRTCPTPVRS